MFRKAKTYSLPYLIMEENEQSLSETSQSNLVISEDIRSYLYESAKWTKFLAIVGFVFTALMVMVSLSVGSLMTAMNNAVGEQHNPYAAMGSGVLTVFLLLTAVIYFYPSFLLLKFSNATKQGVLYGDQESLNAGLSKLKSFFKFWGVLMIIVLGLYALMLLFAIVAGVAASMA
ncbi:MAG: DUF5362 family protein [Bacteroidota bacterium]